MAPAFVIAGGTVAGRHHAQAGRNNQDAFAWRQGERGLVAVACDGCSSGDHSEVGARIGCQLMVQAVFEALVRPDPLESLDAARAKVLESLGRLAGAMSGAEPGSEPFIRAVAEHFLFTIVGAVVTETRAWAFALGDGALAFDGSLETLGPFPGNAPPYLGYALCGQAVPSFELRPAPSVDALRSVTLATDGAAALDLARFLDDPRVLSNPDMVRRLIWMQGRQEPIEDDATVVVVRRAP